MQVPYLFNNPLKFIGNKLKFISLNVEVFFLIYFLKQKVRHNGEIKLLGNKLFISENLHGETIAIEEIEGDQAKIYFYHQLIVIVDLKTLTLVNSKV